MSSSRSHSRPSLRPLLITILLIVSLIVPLTPLGRLFPVSLVPTAHAASPFTAGNLVIFRVGDGVAAPTSAATAAFLDEYTPTGTLVQSIALPTATAAGNRRLTVSGTATTEGLLTRSDDGRYLVVAGYDAPTGTASVATSSASTFNRVIGLVDVNGTIDTSTALADSTGNPRSAASTNGNNLWIASNNTGLRHTTLGGTTSTQLNSTSTNLRQTNIYNGQLYVSAQSGTLRIGTVGTGTPTTAGQAITNLPGFPTNAGSPYGFFFADLNAGVAGVDTLYVADDNATGAGGLQKYSLVGGTWVSSGTISTGTVVRGVTGVVTGSSVTLYATGGSGNGSLFKFTDNTGYNAAVSGSLTTVVSAGANKVFRGVALTPVAPLVSTNPTGNGTANPASVKAGDSTLLTVNVSPGANPTSQSYTVTGNLNLIGGSNQQQFFGSGSSFSFSATVAPNTTPGTKVIPITIVDDQNRTGATSITINVQPENLDHIVISQVYGGGGNSGATYKNDFIELYNPTANTVSLNGWSVQYASAGGSTWAVTDLSGSIAPGAYYLIKEAQGNGGTVDLPTPNATGTIAMSLSDGKVALVDNQDSLGGSCPNDPDIVDFVGYGSASCFEGLGATGSLSNTTAALRNSDASGIVDTNNNASDFTVGAPNPRSSPGGGGGGGSEIAPFVSSTSPSNNATNVLVDANITVNFSEAVNVSGSWFNISCPSGTHAATVTGGPTSYTLNPTVNFANSEQCTVTITANLVLDQDANDPPDQMLANKVWSFTTVSSAGVVRDPNEHLVMGIPSPATFDVANENDYLMKKPEYALSYNRSKAIPNWTSWHLDSSWFGPQSRTNTFRADPELPADWYHVNEFSFSGTGFDRGHMTPSADRTFNFTENAATFLMTNMIPQAPDNNQVTWEGLESFARALVSQGNEVYIVSGGYGQGGAGRNGGITQTVDQGRVVVPEKTWKVLLVLPADAGDDVARVTTSTRTIGVIMPNAQGINPDWHSYIVSVDEVEALTGYNFFSAVPEEIQAVIEANADGNTRPTANAQAVTVAEDGTKAITLAGTDAEGNTLTYAVTGGPSHGTLSGTGNSLTYAPDVNYYGPDSFTFTVADKYLTSTAATVSINVTEVNDAVMAVNDDKDAQEDTALIFPASDLTTNDNAGPNEAGQTLTVTNVISTPDTHGTVALNSGQVTYTPAADYNGPANFDYEVCDNGTTNGASAAQCAIARVNVTVASVNDGPVAVDDSATTDEDQPVTVDVLANDSDSDGGTPALQSVGGATNGSVSIVSGAALFTPSANYHGTGSFTYTVSDGQGGTATGNVSVTINAVNDAPTANAQSVTTPEDTANSITLTASDVETPAGSLVYTVTSGPAHGTLSGTAPNLTYTPAANYNGPDSFQFTVTDTGDGASPALTSAAATVSITVSPVNDAPTANAGADQTIECTGAVTLDGSASFDLDGDAPLSYEWKEGAVVLGTTAVLNTTLSFGQHTITLTVKDPGGLVGTDTVVVNIIDTTAPTIVSNGQMISLWPPDKQYHAISVADLVLSASDSCDAGVNLNSVVIEKVTSDEGSPASGDIIIAGDCKSVQLKADRNGGGNGRVYTITFRVRDAAGNSTTLARQVSVQHDQGSGSNAVDSGVAYTVTSSCP
ncbi:MAG TPA: tandem-95 repeat protein [Pyrinomonadaceae bacterium]|jgi:DNA/RNA endonuclease G (NUC1)